jgi:S1-C subfamily serine protease
LLDPEGRVIGINTAILYPGQGLCFAVPANTAAFVRDEIRAHGRVRRAYLGVTIEEVTLPSRLAIEHDLPSARGVAVHAVERGSPAALAGLAAGDVLVGLGGGAVETIADLHRLLNAEAIGEPLLARLLRGRDLVTVTVRPAEAPLRAS